MLTPLHSLLPSHTCHVTYYIVAHMYADGWAQSDGVPDSPLQDGDGPLGGPERSAEDVSQDDPGLFETEGGVITLTIVIVTVSMILMVVAVGRHIRNRERDGTVSAQSKKKMLMADLKVNRKL